MKKAFLLLFVGSMLTLAACQSKPKTEETGTTADTTSTMMADSAVVDGTAAMADSAAATADTTK